jgi:tripartite-type tricarboxylate transporter receptor subunit TctC
MHESWRAQPGVGGLEAARAWGRLGEQNGLKVHVDIAFPISIAGTRRAPNRLREKPQQGVTRSGRKPMAACSKHDLNGSMRLAGRGRSDHDNFCASRIDTNRFRPEEIIMGRCKTLILSIAVIFCAGSFNWQGDALAQQYPTRPIHLVTGNPPGGATDLIARIISQPLGARLGQNIVIENRPGANTSIAAEAVAKAAPDGHTILYANDSLLVINPHIYPKMGLNPIKDLLPLVTTISNQLVLAVNPKVVPVNDFREFVEFARRPPSPLFYASIGNGSQHHLAMELLKQQAGIDLTHVPYKGGGPAAIAVIAGENHAMFGGSSVLTHIKSGKLKALAVSDKKGWPSLPELPGISEFYPNYRIALWHGVFAPRATPQHIVDKLRAELNAVLAMPDVRDKLITSGAGEPYITTPEQLAAMIRADYERYGNIIKTIGLKVD